MQKKKVYPDLSLYQEIIFLKHWFKGDWIVENVIPYYKPLIEPTKILHRHCLWTSFFVSDFETERLETCKAERERELLQEKFGFNLDKYSGVDKRLLLRNCVVPELGKHILEAAIKTRKPVLPGADYLGGRDTIPAPQLDFFKKVGTEPLQEIYDSESRGN